MRLETRNAFDQFAKQVALLNGVPSALQKFAVTPTIQQRLEQRMQESAGFLQAINLVGVNEQSGELVGLGVSGPIASRTDTTTKARTPRDVSAMDGRTYECKKTDFDTKIRYAMLDAWAKFPNFQAVLRDAIIQRQALDRITIGWHGTSAAATTNLTTNPLLQDVNTGWLQKMRVENAANVVTGGATAGTIKVGATGDHKTLDALVYDMVNELLDSWHASRTDLVAICSRGLLADKYLPLINDPKASEQLAGQIIISQKRLGGIQAASVPFFPEGKILVTPLKNLSIYYQEGARRRMVKDVPEWDSIQNFESSNDAYVIEDLGAAALAENITLV